jgi:hypothetical protein
MFGERCRVYGVLVDVVDEYVQIGNGTQSYLMVLVRVCCRCFGSDRTPGVAPQGVFRSRTVSTTVAKWFVPIARGTMGKIYKFGPLRSA